MKKKKSPLLPNTTPSDLLIQQCLQAEDAYQKAELSQKIVDEGLPTLEAYQGFVRVSLWKWFIAFCACFYADMVVSWEIYREFLHAAIARPQVWMILGMGCFVNGMALVLAELVGKRYSNGLSRLDTYTLTQQYEDSNTSTYVAEYEAKLERESEWKLAQILFWVMIVAIYIFAEQRTELLKVIFKRTDFSFSLSQKAIPIVVFIAEIIAGMYVGHSIKRWKLGWKISKAQSNARKHLANALHFDNMAFKNLQTFKFEEDVLVTLRMSSESIDAMIERCKKRMPIVPQNTEIAVNEPILNESKISEENAFKKQEITTETEDDETLTSVEHEVEYVKSLNGKMMEMLR
jgi:hypothetical protein